RCLGLEKVVGVAEQNRAGFALDQIGLFGKGFNEGDVWTIADARACLMEQVGRGIERDEASLRSDALEDRREAEPGAAGGVQNGIAGPKRQRGDGLQANGVDQAGAEVVPGGDRAVVGDGFSGVGRHGADYRGSGLNWAGKPPSAPKEFIQESKRCVSTNSP